MFIATAVDVARVGVGLCLISGLLAMAAVCAMKGKWVYFALG